MKQTLRKILAVLVVLSIVLSVGIVALSSSASTVGGTASGAVPTGGSDLYFYDSFDTSDSVTNGTWTLPNAATKVQNGVLLSHAGTTYLKDHSVVSALTDYAVEATVKMDSTKDYFTNLGTTNAGIIGRMTNGAGYEFTVIMDKSTKTGKARVYDRVAGKTVCDNLLKGELLTDTEYKLKMVFAGTTLKCFVDDVLVATQTVTERAGTVGVVASNGYDVAFDNFTVRKPTQAELAGEDSNYFYDSFDTSDNITNGTWTLPNTATKVQNGVLLSHAGTTYLKDHSVVSALTDYAVEATVKMDSTKDYFTNIASANAGIIGRMTNGAGYEFAIIMDKLTKKGKARVYDRVGKKPVCDNLLDGQLLVDTEYKLKMVFVGTTLKCFVNDTLVAVETVTERAGTVGVVASNGYDVAFDNFTVRKATQAELDAVLSGNTSSNTSSGSTSSGSTSSGSTSSGSTSSGSTSSGTDTFTPPQGTIFYEDFNDRLKTSDGWSADTDVSNGKLTGNGSHINLTGHAAINAMYDYAIDAEISVDTGGRSPNSLSVTSIVGRYATVGEKTGGYEIGYAVNRDTGEAYIRVFDRVENKNLGTFKNVTLVSGTTYKFTAVFEGASLKVYLDDVLVGEVTVQDRAGTVGLRSGGYYSTYDNLVVRTLPASSGGEPFTPPAGTVFYEDFNDRLKTSDGWSADTAVSGGKLTGNSNHINLTGHTTISAMHDYAIDAEISVDTNRNSFNTLSVTAITGRYATVGEETGGYEIGYAVSRDTGEAYVRVYDRIASKQLGTFKNVLLIPGKTYKFTALFYGTALRIYIDDKPLGEVAVEDRAGTVGLRNAGYYATFDNFVVRTPSDEELNLTAPEADENGIYYKDSFSARTDFINDQWSYEFEGTKMGAAVLSDNDSSTTHFVFGDKAYFGLSDYTVEVKVTIDPEVEATKSPAIFALAGRANMRGYGYEFGIVTNDGDAYLRLYDRLGAVNKSKNTMFTNKDIKIETGKQYTMRLVMVGDTIRAYLDQEKVFEVKNAVTKGTAGLRLDGFQVYVDDFVIRKPTAAESKGLDSGEGNPGTGDSILYVCIAFCALLAAAVALQLAKRRKA